MTGLSRAGRAALLTLAFGLVAIVGLLQAAPGEAAPTRPIPTWTEASPTTRPSIRSQAAMAYDPATREMVLFGGSGEQGLLADTWTWDGTDWTEQHPAASPPARHRAAMAYDPATREMVLFGGSGETGGLTDTWTWDGSTWTEQHPATSPPGRESASMAYDPATGQMVLFGGFGDGPDEELGETWTWDGSTWTEQHPATSPPGRESSSMAYDPATGQVVLFGGYGDGPGEGELADTWTWDGSTWTEQHPATSPPGRNGASMAYDPASGRLVLFGGNGEDGELADTWTWDGSTWTGQHPAGGPPGRSGATMAFDPATGRLVLFGGYSGTGLRNDTWTYGPPPGVSSNWVELQPTVRPSPRKEASMAYDPATGQMVLFGGWRSGGDLGDTWTWDGADWTEQHPAASPSPRHAATMAYDPATREMILFGGEKSPGQTFGDIWTWDGTTWTERHPGTSPPARHGATMAYDPATGQMVLFGGGFSDAGGNYLLAETWTWDGTTWTEQHSAATPQGGEGGAMAYDAATGRVVLFTRTANTFTPPYLFFSDTWTWDGADWTEQHPTTSPPTRVGASMAEDPAAGQLILFGGKSPSSALNEMNDTWTYQPTVAPPSATISSPEDYQTYAVGTPVSTTFGCTEALGGPGIESCDDSNGAEFGAGTHQGSLPTSTPGEQTYTVTAVSADGEEDEASISYTVAKAAPTLASTASEPVALGESISDTADLAGGYEPGGTIAFRAYGPGDTTCAGAPAYTSTEVPVAGNGSYGSSPAFTPTAPGTYRWVASYGGDADNEGASSECGEASAAVAVGRASTTTSLAVTPTSALLGQPVTLTAKVSGHAPTGTVTFTDGSTVIGRVAVGSEGAASLTTSSLAVGAHRLAAAYGGDDDNLAGASAVIEATITAPQREASPVAPTTSSPSPASPTPAPRVNLTYDPNHAHSPHKSGGPRYTFRWAPGEAGTTFLCRLGKARFEPCRSPKVYRHLKPGRHVFEVRAVTADGRKSAIRRIAFVVAGRGRR